MNRLYYGDNLEVLPMHVADESVDLVYLDPPFNSNANYNILFAEKSGEKSASQIRAFDDTWHWNAESEQLYFDLLNTGGKITDLIKSLRGFLGENDMMAYLVRMAATLRQLRRVLKSTGSIYLHCDPTASHYLKLVMDAIFGPKCFRNEIIWKRSHAHSDSKQGAKHYGRITDTLLFYGNGPESDSVWNTQYVPYDEEYVERDYRRIDKDGRRYRIDNIQGPGGAAKGNPFYEVMGVKRYWRYSKERMDELIRAGRIIQTKPGAVPQYKRYLDEMPGVPVQNLWADLPLINNRSAEALGYPTQKPAALLERIVLTSSNEGQVVLDPFCGCGTAISVAQKLNRQWIGIDVTNLAITLIRHRLKNTYGPGVEDTYEVIGEPASIPDAAALAQSDPYQFQW
jgi:adenine specific DNA methylase Mod